MCLAGVGVGSGSRVRRTIIGGIHRGSCGRLAKSQVHVPYTQARRQHHRARASNVARCTV